jgi:hypothetical protein
MRKLRESNEYRKVIIENIVFMQGDDYSQFESENDDISLTYDEKESVNRLLQWYYPTEHETSEYYARDINTEFLGDLIKIDGYKGYFLYSVNTSMGYVGLSRIVEFPR